MKFITLHLFENYCNRTKKTLISDIRAEGLFRKTGNLGRQRLLKEILNQGEELGLEDGTFSPHDCATVLKNYLGELPDPVLTEKHFQAHLQVVGKSLIFTPELHINCMSIAIFQRKI